MCVRLLVMMLVMAAVVGFTGPGEARVHVRPRIIVRTIPRRQWAQVVNNVSGVRQSIGVLEKGTKKSIASMEMLRSEVGALRQQIMFQDMMMLGSFAALVLAVLPALRNSTVNLVSAQLAKLRAERKYDDQIRPVTLVHSHRRNGHNGHVPTDDDWDLDMLMDEVNRNRRKHNHNGDGNGHGEWRF